MGNERQEKTQAIAGIKERVQLSEWQKQIEERQTSEVGVAAWCERQGISPSTYYYRLRKIREHLCQISGQPSGNPDNRSEEEQRVVPISISVSAPRENQIEIRYGELHIFFPGEIPPEVLTSAIGALRSC